MHSAKIFPPCQFKIFMYICTCSIVIDVILRDIPLLSRFCVLHLFHSIPGSGEQLLGNPETPVYQHNPYTRKNLQLHNANSKEKTIFELQKSKRVRKKMKQQKI